MSTIIKQSVKEIQMHTSDQKKGDKQLEQITKSPKNLKHEEVQYKCLKREDLVIMKLGL